MKNPQTLPLTTPLFSLPSSLANALNCQVTKENYSILMTIKLLIRNKKVLDVTIVNLNNASA